jgi:formylglycine-generating enzyme required for sulfatase activity
VAVRRLAPALALLICAACGDRGTPPGEAPVSAAAAPRVETVAFAGAAVRFDLVWLPRSQVWIGRTEVTWDEYLLYCAFDAPATGGVDAVARPSRPLDTHPFDRRWGIGRRPAVGMSAQAAQSYCAWLGARVGGVWRLPNEAEWEEACGPAPAELHAQAWTAANSGGRTQEVGKRLPNALGVHDALGNLWEYCGDGAVLRGGSWRDSPGSVGPASRLAFDEDWVLRDPNFPPGVWWVPDGDHLGFRVVRAASDPAPASGPDPAPATDPAR